jgi:selenocysteine-specific translation elongation factor
MQNIGEEIAGEYLKVILGCDFVEYNLNTPDTQGEIDVVGINAKENKIYICEVAIHLVTGLQYVNPKLKQPENVIRFCKKFRKNIEYAKKYFSEYEMHFMLWSPVVKNQKASSKNNQLEDIQTIQKTIQKEYGVLIEAVINQEFSKRLERLRAYARKETKELKSSVLRLMQIEEKLSNHLDRLESNKTVERNE